MKTRLSALAALCLALGITSCSYRVFPVDALDRGYKDSMISDPGTEALSDIAIYLSEKDAPEGYKLISFAEFSPIIKLPTPVSGRSTQVSNFYKKAVTKAKENGGNAIIVTGPGQFKIISVPTVHKIVKLNEPVKSVQDVAVTQTAEETMVPEARQKKADNPLLDKLKAERQKMDERKAERAEAQKQRAEAQQQKAEAERLAVEKAAAEAQRLRDEKDATVEAEKLKAAAEAERLRVEKAEAEKAAAAEAERQKALAEAAKAEKAAADAAKAEAQRAEKQAKAARSTDKTNPIFNEDNLQWFTSKYIYTATEQEQVQIVQALKEEIQSNIRMCKTAAEAEFITRKIDVLEAYNKALPTPSGTQMAEINGYRNALRTVTQPKNEVSSKKFLDGGKIADSVKSFFRKLKK